MGWSTVELLAGSSAPMHPLGWLQAPLGQHHPGKSRASLGQGAGKGPVLCMLMPATPMTRGIADSILYVLALGHFAAYTLTDPTSWSHSPAGSLKAWV